MNALKEIENREQELLSAMLHSNVQKLDELIADELLFTDHNGQVLTKTMELDAHRAGAFKIEALKAEEQDIRLYGDSAIVSVLLHISGKYLGEDFAGSNRYTRFWIKKGRVWKIAAGHSSSVKAGF